MTENKSLSEKTIEKFKDFPVDNQIKRALSELGFHKPMEVQTKTIPMILEGKDLIVKSQTGSGKTAAFAIPICEKVDITLDRPQALVLAPTRELALQVKEDIFDIGDLIYIPATTSPGFPQYRRVVRKDSTFPRIHGDASAVLIFPAICPSKTVKLKRR